MSLLYLPHTVDVAVMVEEEDKAVTVVMVVEVVTEVAAVTVETVVTGAMAERATARMESPQGAPERGAMVPAVETVGTAVMVAMVRPVDVVVMAAMVPAVAMVVTSMFKSTGTPHSDNVPCKLFSSVPLEETVVMVV